MEDRNSVIEKIRQKARLIDKRNQWKNMKKEKGANKAINKIQTQFGTVRESLMKNPNPRKTIRSRKTIGGKRKTQTRRIKK
jgi:hypothetical protein